MTPNEQNAPEARKTVVFELPQRQAYALAELCKRIGWSDARGLAVSDQEAEAMLSACDVARAGLEASGVWVR
jgi:hypothetical protein